MTKSRYRVIAGEVYEVPANSCPYCLHDTAVQRRPAFHCANCGRHIGANRTHCVMPDRRVWCMTCRIGDGTDADWEQRRPVASGTRAGARHVIEELKVSPR